MKFSVDPDDVALTELLGATGGSLPGDHWYPGTTTSELPNLHGIGIDLNGTVYVGAKQSPGDNIRKLSCLGEIEPVDATTVTIMESLTNLFIVDDIVYVTRQAGPRAYDVCTGNSVGTMCLNDDTGSPAGGNKWGLSYNSTTELVYATSTLRDGRGGSDGQGIYVWTRAELEERVLGTETSCIDPLVWADGPETYEDIPPGATYVPSDLQRLRGIAGDNDGNIYVAGTLVGTGSGVVMKYSSAGVLLAISAISPNYVATSGLVWSETTDLVYIANTTDDPAVDCISAFNSSDLSYAGTAAPNPNLPADNGAKAIAILKECCPTKNNQTLNLNICDPAPDEDLFLTNLFPCESVICEAEWVPADAASAAIYDPCTQAISQNVPGCYTFTRRSDGDKLNNICGAFVQTLNIAIGEVEASIIGGDQEICFGADPEAFTVETAATGSEALSFQWYVSTESDSSGFMPIPGATMEAFDPAPADITADTVYFRNETFITTCLGGDCRDTSNTVVLIRTEEVTANAGEDATVCRTGTLDITSALITPMDYSAMDGTEFGATWTSSGSGDFLYASGSVVTPPVRYGEAVSYRPSQADASAGSVVLTLTTDNLSETPFTVVGCMPVVDELTLTVLQTDCGSFPWPGNR